MRTAIDAQRATRSVEDGFERNRDFHLALVAASGNEHLLRFAEAVWVRGVGSAIYRTQVHDDLALVAGFADEHAAILAAVEAGDAGRAERLTYEHILAAPVPPEPA